MALEFIDGFDHRAPITTKWDTTSGSATFQTGRFGGFAVSAFNNGTQAIVRTSSASATRTLGFALFTLGSNQIIASFRDGGNTQVDLRTDASLHLVVTRNGTTLGTSTNTLLGNLWYYIEFQSTINASSGTYAVKVGGTTWLSATGVNTQATGNANANQIVLWTYAQFGVPSAHYFDDVYSRTDLTFMGESRILTNVPNANGGTDQWSLSTGVNSYANVNQNPPDGDTTYNFSSTPGQIDLYRFPAFSPGGNILAVAANVTARKDDAGVRSISTEYQSGGGTQYTGSNTFPLNSAFLNFQQIYETDPATGAAWTTTNLNNGQFGVNCVA